MRARLTLFATCVLAACSEKVVAPTSAPDRPSALAAVQSDRKVRLTWNSVSDVGATVTYAVYRNDLKLGEVTATEYTDSTIASNASYTWFVSARSASGGVSAPSDPVQLAIGDIDAPRVTASVPSANSSGASRIPFVLVTFNEAMIPLTVTRGGITAKITSSGEPVYGTINYDPSTKSADFWPISILPARTQVTVSVASAARDVAGNGAAPFSFTFTTGDTPSAVDLSNDDHVILVSRSFTAESREIVKMRVDGTDEIRLTSNLYSDLDPSWSPDGRHIAFSSDRDGTYDIFIMRADGTGVTQITSGDINQTQPRWSPDGKRLVFRSTKEGVALPNSSTLAGDIWIMQADGSNQLNLTKTPSVNEAWPDISPDATQILFSGNGGFTVMNIDGTNSRPLKTRDPNFPEDLAAWSPDGKRVAYSAFNARHPDFNENFLLFLVNADGSNVVQLTTGGSQRAPAWSPDGNSLVFSVSGNDEFWGRFGNIGTGTMDLTTGQRSAISPQAPAHEVMSTQAWRR